MPTIEAPGRSRPAKAALRALTIGAACFTAISPLAEVTASVPVPAFGGRPSTKPADVEARVALGPGGRDIRLAGDLTEGVAARVAVLLAANPSVERIHLTSDGGLVDEAEALGALVAERGLATYVPDACASACTLVFVRGRGRYLAIGGQLGFHAPFEFGPGGQIETVDPGAERSAYLAAGVAPDFVARTMAVAPDDIWIPEPSQLREAGVVTELVESDRFPDSTLDADPSPQSARTEILRNLPVLAGLDPAAIDDMAAWFREGYLAGRTEAEAIAGLRRQASAALRRQIRVADDATVLALGRMIRAGLAVAGTEACTALAENDLVTLDEILRHALPGGTGLAPLRNGNLSPSASIADADQAAGDAVGAETRLAPTPCPGSIKAIWVTDDRAPFEAAPALRAILLGDLPARIAIAAHP